MHANGKGKKTKVTTGNRAPKREFDRHSGTGRGKENPKDGAGKGNWGTDTDFAPGNNGPDKADLPVKKSTIDTTNAITMDEYLKQQGKAPPASEEKEQVVTRKKSGSGSKTISLAEFQAGK